MATHEPRRMTDAWLRHQLRRPNVVHELRRCFPYLRQAQRSAMAPLIVERRNVRTICEAIERLR